MTVTSDNSSDAACQRTCGICFDSFPPSQMMAAEVQHQDRPADEYCPVQHTTSTRTAKRCTHYFCTGCMRRYVCRQLQVRILFGAAQSLLVVLAVQRC
jgi:hypothetical protein